MIKLKTAKDFYPKLFRVKDNKIKELQHCEVMKSYNPKCLKIYTKDSGIIICDKKDPIFETRIEAVEYLMQDLNNQVSKLNDLWFELNKELI